MANLHISAIHDRIDEEHFELRLHASAIGALQRRVNELEAAVRELRREAFGALDELDGRQRKTRAAGAPASLSSSK